MITVYELKEMFLDSNQLIRLYDLNNNAEMIYEGAIEEVPNEYEDLDIESIDNIYEGNFDGYIGINVSL